MNFSREFMIKVGKTFLWINYEFLKKSLQIKRSSESLFTSHETGRKLQWIIRKTLYVCENLRNVKYVSVAVRSYPSRDEEKTLWLAKDRGVTFVRSLRRVSDWEVAEVSSSLIERVHKTFLAMPLFDGARCCCRDYRQFSYRLNIRDSFSHRRYRFSWKLRIRIKSCKVGEYAEV